MHNRESHHNDVLENPNQLIEHEAEEIVPSEELLSLQNTLQFMKNKESYSKDPAKYLEVCEQAYKDITGFIINNGGEFETDVTKIYRQFGNSHDTPLIVRRDDPEKVLALSEGHDIELAFDPKVTGEGGEKYVNCSIWPYGRDYVSGIRTSFNEGRSSAGPIVMMIGVSQNANNNKIEETDASALSVGDIQREAVRIVSGSLKKEDLKFILIRVPIGYFPNENLTDDERKPGVTQIFRGFTF